MTGSTLREIFPLEVPNCSSMNELVELPMLLRTSCEMENGLKCGNMRQDHHHSVYNMSDHIYPIGNQIEQVKSFKRFYYRIHK